LKNIKSPLQNPSNYNQQFIHIFSHFEKTQHLHLSNQINQVKQPNNTINHNLKTTNQLIHPFSNATSPQLQPLNLLPHLPNLNK
ncbi:hypothetical protein, partial [Staphylococcus epidermidis]|uniref:hypothetical protein n=1 Tax=Staphylococcus epidermidis TaxID=1282 RepID=UPI001C92D26A